MTKDEIKIKEQHQLVKISQSATKVSRLDKAEYKSCIWLEPSPVCTKILDLTLICKI